MKGPTDANQVQPMAGTKQNGQETSQAQKHRRNYTVSSQMEQSPSLKNEEEIYYDKRKRTKILRDSELIT